MSGKLEKAWMAGYAAACCAAVSHGSVITPVGATASSTWSGTPGYVSAHYLIDGSGLTGTGRPATHTNANAPGLFWHSNTGVTVPNQWLQFDLGAAYTLTNALVWQLAQATFPSRGVKTVTIRVAGPDGVFSTLSAGNQLNQATGAANEPVQVVPLEASGVQYVRFEIETNWGAAGIVGLSEVRFEGFLTTSTSTSLNWIWGRRAEKGCASSRKALTTI